MKIKPCLLAASCCMEISGTGICIAKRTSTDESMMAFDLAAFWGHRA